jgi:hypothetical protein
MAERGAGREPWRGVYDALAIVSGPGTNPSALLLYLPLVCVSFVAALLATIRGPASG